MYKLEGAQKDHWVQPRLGTMTASLGSLFQGLTTFPVKNLFLMSNLNSPWCSFIPPLFFCPKYICSYRLHVFEIPMECFTSYLVQALKLRLVFLLKTSGWRKIPYGQCTIHWWKFVCDCSVTAKVHLIQLFVQDRGECSYRNNNIAGNLAVVVSPLLKKILLVSSSCCSCSFPALTALEVFPVCCDLCGDFLWLTIEPKGHHQRPDSSVL